MFILITYLYADVMARPTLFAGVALYGKCVVPVSQISKHVALCFHKKGNVDVYN